MLPEEFNQLSAEIIANLSDQAKVSEALAKMKETYGKTHADKAKAEEDCTKFKADNENLRATNMKLFLKIGEAPQPTAPAAAKEENKLTFESLFDEKGELK